MPNANAHPRPAYAIPETMLVVELRGAGLDALAVVERPVPRPGPGQVLCRVEAASTCSFDAMLAELGDSHPALHGWDVEKWPIVPGHEASLVIVAVGEGIGNRLRVGQRVIVSPELPGPPRLDEDRYGVPVREIPGVTVGCTVPGFLAQYALLREDVLDAPGSLVQVSAPTSSLPHFGAALAEPFSTVVAAHARMVHIARSVPDGERTYRAGVLPGGIAVVVGAGPVGLFHVCCSLLRRPRHLIVSDPDPVRRAAAARLGTLADLESTELETVDPAGLEARVRAVSAGRGADDIILAVAGSRPQEAALALAGPGACVGFFASNAPEDATVRLDAASLRAKGISIFGSAGSDPHDLRRALDLQERGAVDLGPFVYAVGGLAAGPASIRAIAERRFPGKVIIYPHAQGPELVRVDGWGAEAEARFLSEAP